MDDNDQPTATPYSDQWLETECVAAKAGPMRAFRIPGFAAGEAAEGLSRADR